MLQGLDPGISSVSRIPEVPAGSRALLQLPLTPPTWKSLFMENGCFSFAFQNLGGGGAQSQPKWGLDEVMPVAIYVSSKSSPSLSFLESEQQQQSKQTNKKQQRRLICQ